MLSPVPGPTAAPAGRPSAAAAKPLTSPAALGRAEHVRQQRRVELDQLEHLVRVALVAGRPPGRCPTRRRGRSRRGRSSRSVRKSCGSRTARAAAAASGSLRAQPGPARRRERRHRHDARSARPTRSGPPSASVSSPRLGAERVSFQRMAGRSGRPSASVTTSPCCWPGDRDRADARPPGPSPRAPSAAPPTTAPGRSRARRPTRSPYAARGRSPRPTRSRDRPRAPSCPASSSRRPRRAGSQARNSLTGGQGASSLLRSRTNCNGRSERGEMATETQVGAAAPDLTPRPGAQVHVRALDGRPQGERPVRRADPPGPRPVRDGAQARRARRLRRLLPRQRPDPAGHRRRPSASASSRLPQGARRDRHEGLDGHHEPVRATRSFKDGAFTSNDRDVRRYALQKTLRGIDLGRRARCAASTSSGAAARASEADAAKPARDALERYREAVDFCCELRARPGLRHALRHRAQAERAARRHLPADGRARARLHRAARPPGDGRREPRGGPRDDGRAQLPARASRRRSGRASSSTST